MAVTYPDIGDVLYTSGGTLREPRLMMFTGAMHEWLVFESPQYKVSATKWRAYYKYNYTGLTGEPISEIDYYRPYWEIDIKFNSNAEWRLFLLKLRAGMDRQGLSFSSAGVGRAKRFYFDPPGDGTRPRVEVTLKPGDIGDIEFFGDRYMAYQGHKIILLGLEKYYQPYLNLVIPMPPGVGDAEGYYGSGYGLKVMT